MCITLHQKTCFSFPTIRLFEVTIPLFNQFTYTFRLKSARLKRPSARRLNRFHIVCQKPSHSQYIRFASPEIHLKSISSNTACIIFPIRLRLHDAQLYLDHNRDAAAFCHKMQFSQFLLLFMALNSMFVYSCIWSFDWTLSERLSKRGKIENNEHAEDISLNQNRASVFVRRAAAVVVFFGYGWLVGRWQYA